MAIWGALAKGAIGAVKGGAKKIAADKLLNRSKKKKPQKPQKEGAEQEKGGALAIRPTTSLVPTGPTGIVPSPGGDLATTGGKGETPEEILLNINTKIIRVDRLLKGSFAIKEKQRQDAKKQAELDENKREEAALEKKKPKGAGKFKIPGAGKAKSLIGRVIEFITTIFLGYWAVRLVDWLPKIAKWAPVLGKWIDRGLDALGWIVDGLSTVIKFGYDLVGKMEGWVKNVFGEEGAEKFRTFMGNLKDLIAGFLLWKIIGEKIFKAIVGAIKNVWKTVTKAIRTIWVKLRRLVGRHVRKFFGNLVKRAGGALKAAGQGVWNVAKGIGSKVGGLFSKGAGAVAKTGAGKAVAKVGGWAAKIFGKAAGVVAPALKAATPAVKGFARRIPILGPIIVAIVSLMSGEGIGQALFKSVGAALGGALGTFIPIPILGTLIGETIGMFIGDLLYYTIIERNPKKAFGMLKGALSKIFSAGKAVAEWLGGGIKRYIENFLKDTAIEIPEGGGRHSAMTLVAKTLGLFDWLKGLGYVNAEGRVSKFPNLLQLMNPFKTIPIAIKSFFPPGGEESGSTGSTKEVKSGDTGGDDKSKGLEKQEKALISANQKKGYAGVMEEIESYAPYEDISAATTVSVSVPSSGQSPSGGGDSSRIITVGGGGDNWKADAFESLDFYG